MNQAVLVVDDEPDLLTLYELTLLREGHDVDTAASVEEAWARLTERGYALVICDLRLPDGNGLDLLRRLDAARRRERVIVVTAYGSTENAVEALKAGAFDYLTKPVDLRQFRQLVNTALGQAAPPAAAPQTAPRAATPAAPRALVGEAPAMVQVRDRVDKVARSMAPVLVQGESGTGKELVARAIHAASPRAGQPFVAVNCGAIPEHLIEAEFFGYRKGAFTGANEDRAGFFLAAQGGTLFLDEIGDLPLAMQPKLLRVIQERAVRPVGATAETPTNVRIVSATHRDLAADVADGRFRQDLYYRLNVIAITVPPLRERMADLPALAQALLTRIARDAGVADAPPLTEAALARLACHPFPGNVRELENLLHRAVALAAGAEIAEADLGLPAHEPDALDETAPLATAEAAAEPANLPADLARHLDEVERSLLLQALHAHGFNRTAAGARMGLTLRQMRYRMARLGISDGDAA